MNSDSHDPLVERSTDPASSRHGVKRAGRNELCDAVLEAAYSIPQPFSDHDLHHAYELLTGLRRDRSVIARTRLRLVRNGRLERVYIEGSHLVMHKWV